MWGPRPSFANAESAARMRTSEEMPELKNSLFIEMKKVGYYVAGSAVLMAASIMASCGGADKTATDNKAQTPVSEKETADSGVISSLNVRYVDEEKLLNEYNLAKDFQESIQRSQSKLMSAQQSRENDIRQLGSQIETKMNSNGYKTESEYNADMAKFQKKQQDAQSYLANLQRTTEIEISQLQAQLQDSIKSYMEVYSKANGYDAVLLKSAGFYFNPALDITENVVKGLNERYNKLAK